MKSVASASRQGFSMMELIIVITIIGVLAFIAIPLYSNSLEASRATIARNLTETLDQAVHRFNETNYEFYYTGIAASGQDEMVVLRTMQYRDPSNPQVGAPYVRTDYNPAISSSSKDYRVRWEGTLFRLLSPGTVGTGLKVDFTGADLGTPYTFPAGFTMAGK